MSEGDEVSVNHEYLKIMMEMGIKEHVARKVFQKQVLMEDGASSKFGVFNLFVAFLLLLIDKELLIFLQALITSNNECLDTALMIALELNEELSEEESEDSKMIFVVNSSLNMSVGKTAAQVNKSRSFSCLTQHYYHQYIVVFRLPMQH